MSRMKWTLAMAAALALGLVSARATLAQDNPPERPPRPNDRWEQGAPPRDGPAGERGPRRPDDRRQPGPPRDGDDQPMLRGDPMNPSGPVMIIRSRDGHFPGGLRWPHEDWGTMEKNDPEMFKLMQEDSKLDRQTHELAMQYRQAPTDQREKIKKDLQEAINKQFDARQQRRSLELKRLEGELQRLKESIDARNKSREQIVDKRVTEMLGNDVDVGFWADEEF